MRRRNITPLKERVRKFYGGCVICSINDKSMTDVAHIDENSNNNQFANLLILCCNHNASQERTNYRNMPQLPIDLKPENLQLQALDHFSKPKPNYPAAYGCQRLAHHLFATRDSNFSRALESLVYAIGAIRPLANAELLVATFQLARNFIVENIVPKYWRAAVLDQLGLVLYDFEKYEIACESTAAASELYRGATDSIYKEDFELRKYGADRRRLFVFGQAEDEEFAILNEGTEAFIFSNAHWQIETNLHTEAFLKFEAGHSPSAILDILEAALDEESKINNSWVLAEIYFLKGRALELLGDKQRAKEEFQRAYEEFLSARVVPEPSRVSGQLDPAKKLRNLGLSNTPLLSQRGNLGLSKENTRKIISDIYEGCDIGKNRLIMP